MGSVNSVEIVAETAKAARAGAEIWLDPRVAFEVLEIVELKEGSAGESEKSEL